MKQTLINYFILCVTLLLFTFFTSLILTLLDINEVLPYKTGVIVCHSLSYFTYAILSYILGIKMKRKGLIHGVVFSLIAFLLSLVIGGNLHDLSVITKEIIRSIVIIFFTILGVNKKNS